jgi:hypothetical protein
MNVRELITELEKYEDSLEVIAIKKEDILDAFGEEAFDSNHNEYNNFININVATEDDIAELGWIPLATVENIKYDDTGV